MTVSSDRPIEIEDLRQRFGRREVVCGLSLTVERGAIYGLLGPNGSGKTTTLSCALGLMRPTSGRVRILGEPAARVHRLGGRLGVVFDSAIALPGQTADGNLTYLRKLLGHSRGRTATEVLELVGLADIAGTRARSLSLGQRRRLAIAGALLGEPELLVLDEPLAGLDTMGVRRMLRLFRALADEGLTLLLSSHRLHEMQTVITHAGILFDGVIARGGTLGELLGEGSGRYSLVVNAAERAYALIEDFEGAELLDSSEHDERQARLLVSLPEERIAALNRGLLEAGCEVTAIEPRVETLQSVFEAIVDARSAEEVPA
jgi:ABC-2 type transport system ATP-binding protein